MEKNNLKELVKRFFESIGCVCEENRGILQITNISSDFEKFFGKKGPYNFVFEKDLENEKCELITPGSYLLKIINDYLEGKAETTLLKINIDFNEKEEISRIFPIKNGKISSIEKNNRYVSFERFTFLTTFEYGNKKEQFTFQIFTKDNKIFNIDLSSLPLSEGKKRDVEIDEKIDSAYSLAKESIQEILKPKILEVEKRLEKNLEKDIDRVRNHFKQMLSELDAELNSLKSKVSELKKDLKKNSDSLIQEKIKRLEEKCKELENNDKRLKIKKEEEFFIQDEIQKNSLNIKTKLINTSIIYYPVFNLRLFVKTKTSGRFIPLSIDSIEKKISPLFCDSCGSEIKEIIVCSSGHLTCRNCGEICPSCKEIYCKKCLSLECPDCKRKVCEKCIEKCEICKKKKCKFHFLVKGVCNSCSKRCFNCGKIFSPNFIRKDNETGRDICDKCHSNETGRRVLREINE
jgi:hypothetical protein